MESWPLILGWPMVALAMAASVWGLIRRRPAGPFGAAIVLLPLSLYLATTPRYGWLGLLLPVILVSAALALRAHRRWLATLLLVLPMALFLDLARMVLTA